MMHALEIEAASASTTDVSAASAKTACTGSFLSPSVTEAQRLANTMPVGRYPGELAFGLLWAGSVFAFTGWVIVSLPPGPAPAQQYQTLFKALGVIATVLAAYSLQIGVGALLWTTRYEHTRDTDWRAAWQEHKKADPEVCEWEEVQHFVIVTAYEEPLDSLRAVARSLVAQRGGAAGARSLCRRQIALVLALEEREGVAAREKAAAMEREFGGDFREVLAYFHPAGRPDEIAGKASNYRYAVEQVDVHVRSGSSVDAFGKQIVAGMCIVHVADGDSLFDPNHFPCVTHDFATSSDRYDLVFQPCVLSVLNFWRLTPWARQFVLMHGAQEMMSARGPWEFQLPYSTYALALDALREIGGPGGAAAAQDGDVIAEDHHLFIKGFFATSGRLRVRPVYLPCLNFAVAGNECLASLCCWRQFVGERPPGCDSRFTQAARHMVAIVELAYFLSLLWRGAFPGQGYGFGPRRWRVAGLLLKLFKVHFVAFVGLWMLMGAVLLLVLLVMAVSCDALVRAGADDPLPQACDFESAKILRLPEVMAFLCLTLMAFVGTGLATVAFTRMLFLTQENIEVFVARPRTCAMGSALLDGRQVVCPPATDAEAACPLAPAARRGLGWRTAFSLFDEYGRVGGLASVYYGFLPATIALLRVIWRGHRLRYVSAAMAARGSG